MNFFKPEDFKFHNPIGIYGYDKMAQMANAKLEREGVKIYFGPDDDERMVWTEDLARDSEKKALLINIEPIEKCKHPPEKIIPDHSHIHLHFRCECGVLVKPSGFEEIK